MAPPVDIIIFLLILDISSSKGQSSTEQDAIFNTSTPNSSNKGRDSLSKGVETLKRFLKRYKSQLPTMARATPDDYSHDENRHYIYDKEWNYTIIFVINDTEPEEFTILTAYPDPPRIPGTMTKWEV